MKQPGLTAAVAIICLMLQGCYTVKVPGEFAAMSDWDIAYEIGYVNLNSMIYFVDWKGGDPNSYRLSLREELISRHPEWDEQVVQAIHDGKALIGMHMMQVIAGKGRPSDYSSSHKSSYGKSETWRYGGWPNDTYLYFENGRLASMSEFSNRSY